MATLPIARDTVSSAVSALAKWMHGRSASSKPQLLLDDRDDFLVLLLSLRRIPSKSRTNPFLLPLPHPLFPLSDPDPALSPSVFLIIDDRHADSPPPSSFLQEAKEHNLPISEVIGISTLRTDYRPFESRRKLCGSYDLFLADKNILPLLPRLLGKHFFQKKKIPLPVNLSRVGWKDQIKRILNSTFLYIRSGTTCGIRVGRLSMQPDQIADNVMAVINEAVLKIPKKWGNVRSFHLKAVDSVALPIYQAIPEMGLKIEVAEREDSGVEEVIDGEEGVGEQRSEKKKKKGGIRYMDGATLLGQELVEEDGEEDGDKEKNKKRKKRSKDGAGAETNLDNMEVQVEKKKKKKADNQDETEAKTKMKNKSQENSEEDGEEDGDKEKNKKRKKRSKNGAGAETNLDNMEVQVEKKKKKKKKAGNQDETEAKTKMKNKSQENSEVQEVKCTKTKKNGNRVNVNKMPVVPKGIVEKMDSKEKSKGKRLEAGKEVKQGKKNKMKA